MAVYTIWILQYEGSSSSIYEVVYYTHTARVVKVSSPLNYHLLHLEYLGIPQMLLS